MRRQFNEAASPPLRVGILLTAQFTLNALANFVDVLRLASDDGDRSGGARCRWYLMSATGDSYQASCGFRLAPTSSLIDFSELDYIALIGGLLYRGRPVDEHVRSYLLRAGESRLGLIGVCTGIFVLCRLGLMAGRRCCISGYHHRDFVQEFAGLTPVADKLYVVDGNRITSCGGVGAALTAAKLVEWHLGQNAAQKALHIMQIGDSQGMLQPAPPTAALIKNDIVARSLLLMERNLAALLTIDEIAARLHTSRRNLERKFKRHLQVSPYNAYVDLRFRHVQAMLGTRKSFDQIAEETGFSNSASLRAAYKRLHGCSLADARRRRHASALPLDAKSQEQGQPRVFAVGTMDAAAPRQR